MDNYAIRINRTGGPAQLELEELPVPQPGQGEVLVRNMAIGLNFIDVYHRTGLYPVPLPFVPGGEGAGVVEAVGPGVAEFAPGDRVAYVDPLGAYSLRLTRPQQRLVKLPGGISDEVAAASMLKGLTVHYLIHGTWKLAAGETILVHAAAGGVGQILCQWARHKGATVIGTVGSAAKAGIAREAGCAHVLDTSAGPIAPRVRELTAGEGVPVVYDGIGAATFFDSLDCLAPRGLMVSYGNASGAVPPFSLGELAKRGSLYATRPSLTAYVASTDELRRRAADLFAVIASGAVHIAIGARYPLREAARAHEELEARRTTGSTVLLP